MRTITVQLSSDQLATVRLALIGWGVRCENEARTMDKLADETEGALSAKATANAAASRRFEEQAKALLDALP